MFHAKFSLFSKTKPLENKSAAKNIKKSTSKSNKSSMTPIISAVISKPNSIPRT